MIGRSDEHIHALPLPQKERKGKEIKSHFKSLNALYLYIKAHLTKEIKNDGKCLDWCFDHLSLDILYLVTKQQYNF